MIRNRFSPMELYPLITILLLSLPFHGNTQTPNQERAILLSLKQHWPSAATSLAHWTSSSDHCTWPEITCSAAAVTAIRIINASITETIPPSICDLSSLTHVDLQWNFIPATFPSLLYNCSNLQYLDLSQNYFIGTLPNDIDRLSSTLQFLNLSFNNFTGSIPSSIGRLLSLSHLDLSANRLNGSIPPEIGRLSNLEHLVLSYNSFRPHSSLSSFTGLNRLKNLWMTETNLIGEIPDSIGNLSALQSLDLSVNVLTGTIPPSLFLLKNLTHLFLYKNRLSGPIPPRIEALDLRVLDLSNNTLTGTIPDGFGGLTRLTGLALFFNQLSGEVPASIGRLPEIVDIGLYSNNLSGKLPPDFGRYSKLRRFQVCLNQFDGELPIHLCANKALIGVIAFENKLSGELPDSLGDCETLETVRIENNGFSGRIPDGLWTLNNLTTLTVSNNMFSGQLPEKVGPQLSLVEVMNNRFSGRIPVGISSWESLHVLRASNNMLSGEVPQELTALSSLSILLLDYNNLSGNLPWNIVSWKSLTTLSLSRNHLSGEIPASIWLLPDLNYLNLSGNEFSGRIPAQSGQMRLSSLDVSSNRLSGTIPSVFENAAFESSFLNNSGLCSNIPSLGLSRCSRSHEGARKSSKVSSRFIAAVSSIAVVAAVVMFMYTIYICRKGRKISSDQSTWKLTSFQRVKFTEASILRGLTEENVIGSGGSGKVYRVAINQSGECVAVKRIWDKVKLEQRVEKEFLSEVGILGTIRHSNIVKLLCCISSDNSSKLLVYEYMENRSLDRWIHGRKNGVEGLDWAKKLRIAIGAAQGLCYMHHHCSPPIIHRDVKSSNILLDSEFNAKIADFGVARMLATKHGEPNTMSLVAGSFGYMPPEYAQTRRVNEKIDVYSFGVVLLELITGREAQNGDESSSLAQWAWRQFEQGSPILQDTKEDPLYSEDINTVLKLGLICTSSFPSSRPSMKDVLQILLGCAQHLPALPRKTNENDVAPLLPQTTMPDHVSDDNLFISII